MQAKMICVIGETADSLFISRQNVSKTFHEDSQTLAFLGRMKELPLIRGILVLYCLPLMCAIIKDLEDNSARLGGNRLYHWFFSGIGGCGLAKCGRRGYPIPVCRPAVRAANAPRSYPCRSSPSPLSS